MLLAIFSILALFTQAQDPVARTEPTTRIGDESLGYVIYYENVPLFDLIMYVSDLHLSMASALGVSPSEVTAVNIDSNNALNSVTISYVVTHSDHTASLLEDHEAFYSDRLRPQFANVDGLAELLGLDDGGSESPVISTTVAPVTTYLLTGPYDADALRGYTSDLANAMSQLLGGPAVTVDINDVAGTDATIITWYVTGDNYAPVFSQPTFESTLLATLAQIEGLNIELGLVTSFTTTYSISGTFDTSLLLAVEDELVSAMATFLGMSDTSKISLDVSSDTITWTVVDTRDYTDLMTTGWSNAFVSYLNSIPSVSSALSPPQTTSSISSYQWSGEFNTVMLQFFTQDLIRSMSAVTGISPDAITVDVNVLSNNAGTVVWTINGNVGSQVTSPEFLATLEAQMETVPVLRSLMVLPTTQTTTQSVQTRYIQTGSWGTEIGQYTTQLEQAMATVLGIPVDDVNVSIEYLPSGQRITWTMNGDYISATESQSFLTTLDSVIMSTPGLNSVWSSGTTATITFPGVSPSQLQPYELQMIVNLMTTMQQYGQNVNFNDISVDFVDNGDGTSVVFTINGGDYQNVFTDDFWNSFTTSLSSIDELNRLLFTSTFSFPVYGTTVSFLTPYTNDFINAFSSATGIPQSQISVNYEQQGSDVIVTYTYTGYYPGVITDTSMTTLFNIFASVPGLGQEIGLVATFPFTVSSFPSTNDINNWISVLAPLLGVPTSSITYTITPTGTGDYVVNFNISEGSSVVVNPDGSVTFAIQDPTVSSTVSGTGFTNSFWTSVLQRYPQYVVYTTTGTPTTGTPTTGTPTTTTTYTTSTQAATPVITTTPTIVTTIPETTSSGTTTSTSTGTTTTYAGGIGETAEPTQYPTALQCEGVVEYKFIRVEPACFTTVGNIQFDVGTSDIIDVIGIPAQAQQLVATLDADGDMDILIMDEDKTQCLIGPRSQGCTYALNGEAFIQGMKVTLSYNGVGAQVITIERVYEDSVNLRLVSNQDDVNGRIDWEWQGTFPCGRRIGECRPCAEFYCEDPDAVKICDGSENVICSSSTLPPSDDPSPAPTDSPSNEPTPTPTGSPTYEPTPSPTGRPTDYIPGTLTPTKYPVVADCDGVLEYKYLRVEPACFDTVGNIQIDSVRAGDSINVVGVPPNAQELIATLTSDGDVDMSLYSSVTGGCILGNPDEGCTNSQTGTYVIDGMQVTYSGYNSPTQTIEIGLTANYQIDIRLNAKTTVDDGRIDWSWHGTFPCGRTIAECRPCSEYQCDDPEAVPVCDGTENVICDAPTPRPTSPPSDSPTDDPTYSPTRRTNPPSPAPTRLECNGVTEYTYVRIEPACLVTTGETEFDLSPGTFVNVVGIPEGARDVNIVLTVESGAYLTDVDLSIFDDRGVCIAGPQDGCVYKSADGGTPNEHGGSFFTYSGDDTTSPISEIVTSELVTFQTGVRATAKDTYTGSAIGRVDYSWNGIKPCGEITRICRPCAEYECPNGGRAICDGSENVICYKTDDPTPAPTYEPSPEPTPTPTGEPSYEPSPEPTPTPTDSPSTEPSKAPSCSAGICNDYFDFQIMGGTPWVDALGNTCVDYSYNPDVMCTTLGQAENNGLKATDVCCACMGGEVGYRNRCYRNCEVTIIMEMCDEAGSGTIDFPTATLRDNAGNEVTVTLDPAEADPPAQTLATGTRYVWRVPTGVFTSHYVSTTLQATGGDEFCVQKLYVNYREESPAEPYWMDAYCGETNNICQLNQYSTAIFDTCYKHSSTTNLDLRLGAWTFVNVIPIGTIEYAATLNAAGDLDIRLTTEDGRDIVGLGDDVPCNNQGLCNFEGMQIFFSGDDTTAPVSESIRIYGETNQELVLLAFAYDDAFGTIDTSWEGIAPCNLENESCEACSTYSNCPSGLVPVCDGSSSVSCVPPSEQAAAQSAAGQNYFVNGVPTTCRETLTESKSMACDWPSLDPTYGPTHDEPTKYPSRDPTPEPTPSPTENPTGYPTPAPSTRPTTSPTPRPTYRPTTSPTSGPTYTPTDSPTDSPMTSRPTYEPTPSPTDNPTSSRPTYGPTTSPTTGPTTMPTPRPTYSPTCESGMLEIVQAQAPCEEYSRTSTFDLRAGEVAQIFGFPINAIEASAILTTNYGDADIQLWSPTESGNIECILGTTPGCTLRQTGKWNGMEITFSGGDSTAPVTESVFVDTILSFMTLRIYAPTATSGSITYRYTGIAPCGNDDTVCIEPPSPSPTNSPTSDPSSSRPTYPPTTSPTTRPTSSPTNSPTDNPATSRPSYPPTSSPTSNPTPTPTESPTFNPMTSRPTYRPTTTGPSYPPTTSPTSNPTPTPTEEPTTRPTQRPTMSPTDCPPPMLMSIQAYPPCFATTSTTSFDLAPYATQTVIFTPLNANTFEALMVASTGTAEMKWIESSSIGGSSPEGTTIVGRFDGLYQQTGAYTYGDMPFYYARTSDTEQKITADLVSIGTFVTVTAGASGATGGVTLSWNGVSPCGDVVTCIMPPTYSPTTSPTTRPTYEPTPSPTNTPTYEPSPSPTNPPTDSPTDSPDTSRPTYPPTTSPTTRPTYEPTPSPTNTPTYDPSPSPTNPPTESPTDSPDTARPTYRPTTSPTSRPTEEPTLAPTDCPPGMILQFRENPPCYETNTNTDFDLAPYATQTAVFVPLQAVGFEIVLEATGDVNMVLVESDSVTGSNPQGTAIVGRNNAVFGTREGEYTYQGMELVYSGADNDGDVRETVSSPIVSVGIFINIEAGANGGVGKITTRWNGISPCGREPWCMEQPTYAPTTSPTTRPTYSPSPSPTGFPSTPPTTRPTYEPTPSPTNGPTYEPSPSPTNPPTDSPTDSPDTSRPTYRPTTSPTSRPTEEPTMAPTGCPYGMILRFRENPPCYKTNTNTDFDLAAYATQTMVFVPLQAVGFEIVLEATGDVNMVLVESDSVTSSNPQGLAIVGRNNAVFGTREGTYTYKDMLVTYSGADTDGSVTETLSSPLVSVGVFINIEAGRDGAVGTITTRWNGVSPCGTQPYCIHPPTAAPSPKPSPSPMTSDPTYPPTTSPTSGPTTSPTFTPTPEPTSKPSGSPTPCMDGLVSFVRAQNPCYPQTGRGTFDFQGYETSSIVGLPLQAKDFEATLDISQATLSLWGIDSTGSSICIYGGIDQRCELNSSGTTSNGMEIRVRGIGNSIEIPVVTEFVTLRVSSVLASGATGVVTYGWAGINPCGEDEHICIFPPTYNPTTSGPTPSPTDSPTYSPDTSRPTYPPTTSPSSRPTTSPTLSPTDCEHPSYLVDIDYPPCYRTESNTDFDLAPGARQIVLFMPLQAKEAEVTMTSNFQTALILVDSDTQTEIIGKPTSLLGDFSQTSVYGDTEIVYSGADRSSPVSVTLTSPELKVGTYIVVENTGYQDAQGTVTATWNGVEPCGRKSYCQDPPTLYPSTSPTTRPTSSPTMPPTLYPSSTRPTYNPSTTRPSYPPTTSPTSNPTPTPTESPTRNPLTSVPTYQPSTSGPSYPPTTSPTSNPTPTPTEAPSYSPTDKPSRAPTPCPPPMIRFTREYPPCYATNTRTDYDLAPNARQTVVFIPLNSLNVVATLVVETGDASLIWAISNNVGQITDGDVIVGTNAAPFQTEGDYVYQDVEFYYSGRDSRREVVRSPIVSLSTYMQVDATYLGSTGYVELSWTGVSPCGLQDYCAHPPTYHPTTSPTTNPTPSPTDAPTYNPTPSIPTRRPTLHPTTSRPTYNPSTSRPTNKPSPKPSVGLGEEDSAPPTPCQMGDYEEKIDELTEEYEDLVDKCNMLQDELNELSTTCSRSVSGRDCDRCAIQPKEQFTGSVQNPIVSLGRATAVNLPLDLDTGYPDQTVYVEYNNEIYIYRPDIANDRFQRTCVGYGLEALYCDSSRVVCAGGSVYGSQEDIAAALKVSATSRIDKVHPNCPTGCQVMDGAMVKYFQSQDSDLDTSRICIYSDEYYYIEDDGTYTYTCVGYGLETEVCPAHKMVCVGFEEASGLPTYGWFGEQARAVKKALNEHEHLYPSCPGS